jgi:hypothetical protein
MAEPLTEIQEPGFFSEIQEAPSLFLLPGSVNVVGLMGEGKATKTKSDDITRATGATPLGDTDALSSPIAKVNSISSASVFRFPVGSWAVAFETDDLSGDDASLLEFKYTLEGGTEQTFVFGASDDTPAEIAAALNGISGLNAEVFDTNFVRVYADSNKSIFIGAGSANTPLGLTDNTYADRIYWFPAAVALPGNAAAPDDGDAYSVNYETPKVAADFKPKIFTGLRQVVAEYGDPSAANTLPLGAQAAFGNGASFVTCRQFDPTEMAGSTTQQKSEIQAALSDMELQDINVLVPMVPLNKAGVDMTADYITHVSKMSSKLERKERTAIVGLDEKAARLDTLGGAGTWQGFLAGFDAPAASGLEAKRIIVVNPGKVETSFRGAAITTDGTYLAACLAGREVSSEFDEAEPMTRKTFATVDRLIEPELPRPEKNALTGFGVTVIERSNALTLVRRAVTADSSSIASQEPSIVRAFDKVASEVRTALEDRYVGSKITSGITTSIEAATETFLQRLVDTEIIGAFRNIKAEQNTTEPRQVDISFEAIPVFPFIWGFVDISINIT